VLTAGMNSMSNTVRIAHNSASLELRRMCGFGALRFGARRSFVLVCCFALAGFGTNAGVSKMKLTGYLTARASDSNLMIRDYRIELSASSKIFSRDDNGEHPFKS